MFGRNLLLPRPRGRMNEKRPIRHLPDRAHGICWSWSTAAVQQPIILFLRAADNRRIGGRVETYVKTQRGPQIPELEEVAAADIVDVQIAALHAVDPDGLAAGLCGFGVVRTQLHFRAVGGVGRAGGDGHRAGRLIKAHPKLGAGAIEEVGQIPELEIVGAVDVVLLAVRALAVHRQLLRREHHR